MEQHTICVLTIR